MEIRNGKLVEPAREVEICDEAEVIVAGGGPGGHSAAIAAARSGARTVLIERYGYLGGMSTGGLVTLIHSMSDGTNNRVIGGLCQEWIDRLDAWGAADHPADDEVGSTDPEVLKRFPGLFFAVQGHLIYGARLDPEVLKCVLNDMVEESNVELYLHSWVVQAIVEKGVVKGVIIESKSGRKAILGKVVIDATGDGDLLPATGVEFETRVTIDNRLSTPALTFELANVDVSKNDKFRLEHPDQHSALMEELEALGGFTRYFRTMSKRQGVVHFNMFLKGYDVLNVKDLTRIEVETRKRIMITYEFFKKRVPGFEGCFIMITAPQVGVRGSRRLVGQYTLTEKDAFSGEPFDDTIAEFPPLKGNFPEHPHVFVPYRVLVPKSPVEGLLVAGRTFSSDEVMNEHYNTISHCIAMGQAAGTAAALAVETGGSVRHVDCKVLQQRLMAAGVPLPALRARYSTCGAN